MQRRLVEELQRADADVPARERLVEILNSAKDRLANEMEIIDSDLFTARQSYAVTTSDTYMALPSDFVRVVGLTRTDTTQPVEVEIIDQRERHLRQSTTFADLVTQATNLRAPTVYLEGGNLYFVNTLRSGMTILLRYRKRLADLTITDGASRYSDIPVQWDYLIVDLAGEHAVPAKSREYGKIAARVSQGFSRLAAALSQRNDAQQHFVKMVW